MSIFTRVVCSLIVFVPLKAFSAESKIRIAYPAAGTIVSAQVGLIFEKTDILKKNGLAATVFSIGTGRELKTALVSDRVDVILTSQANFVVLLGEGFPAKAINSLGSAGRMALVVKKDSAPKTLSDLKGQKIATIFGTSLHQPAIQWAKEAGGASVVNISQVGALHAALESGAVAAVLTYDPFLVELAGRVRILKEDQFDLITVAADQYAKGRPKEMAALNTAFKEAVVYLRTHREQVNLWFSERAKLSVRSIEEASKFNRNYSAKPEAQVDLAISESLLRKLNTEGEFLFREKIVKKLPDIGGAILTIK